MCLVWSSWFSLGRRCVVKIGFDIQVVCSSLVVSRHPSNVLVSLAAGTSGDVCCYQLRFPEPGVSWPREWLTWPLPCQRPIPIEGSAVFSCSSGDLREVQQRREGSSRVFVFVSSVTSQLLIVIVVAARLRLSAIVKCYNNYVILLQILQWHNS